MNKSTETISRERLVSDLRQAGVPEGCLLHLKISLKSIGKVEGGPDTVLQAILDVIGPKGTIVIDSFITSYPLPLSAEHAAVISTPQSPSYAGTVANAMIRHPQSVRSQHPIQRYTAIGPLAHELMDKHTPRSGGYEVLDRMAGMGALNLSIGRKTVGVGTTHVAIEKMGFEKKNPAMGLNYRKEDGSTGLFEVNWNGGCGRGFPKFLPLYETRGYLKWVKIGEADAVLTDMKGTLEVELQKLKDDPAFFFCDDPTCKDCQLHWAHSKGNYWVVKYHSLQSILKQKFAK